MSTFTDARDELVAAFTSAGLTAYGYTPATMIPPVITIDPDDPWIAPGVLGESFYVRLQATVSVSQIDPAMAQAQLEDILTTAIGVIPAGWLFEGVDSPESDSTGSQGDVLAANIHLMALITFVRPVPPSPPGMPVAVDIRPDGPGWYTCSVTWTAPVDEGSSPIDHYEVVVNGVVNVTPDASLIVTGIRVPAGSQYQVYVIAVNNEAKSSPSDSNIIYPPPT